VSRDITTGLTTRILRDTVGGDCSGNPNGCARSATWPPRFISTATLDLQGFALSKAAGYHGAIICLVIAIEPDASDKRSSLTATLEDFRRFLQERVADMIHRVFCRHV